MKIIGSDYDGTLNFNGIDDRKRAAIEKWRDAGNVFTVISGRAVQSVQDLQNEQTFGCDYYIGSNGARIVNGDGETVFMAPCKQELMIPLLTFLFELDCPIGIMHTDPPCYILPTADKCTRAEDYPFDNMPDIPFYTQISTFVGSFEEASVIAAKVRERFGEDFNPLQNGNCIDIVRADINKAQGLYRLAELVGAGYDDIIAVGDNINDRDMIAEFRSYAMENGVDEIKALAKFTTPGVAELIARELGE